MCTLTIIPNAQGFVLTMNRDERRNRHEAGLHDAGVLCYPVDGEAKGTWVGVNQQGIAMALLNRYQEPTREGAISRGHIIVEALKQGSYEQVAQFMKQLKAEQYNPFDCVIASAQEILHFTWTGSVFTHRALAPTEPLMLSSSSVKLEETLRYRHQRFKEWYQSSGQSEEIDRFHLYQQPNLESCAVMMSREITHTKSLTQIKVDELSCALDYYDENAISANAQLSELEPTAQWQYSPFVATTDSTEGLVKHA